MNKDYIWKHRDSNWIKDNPGKSTMYKEFLNTSSREDLSVSDNSVNRVSESIISRYADAGVYIIMCESEKYVYIGQSINVDVRIRNHKMKIFSDKKQVDTNIYTKIRNHVNQFGEDCLSFVKYIPMPYCGEAELLKKETETMIEFLKNGYVLYNEKFPKEVLEHTVFCPKEFQFEANNFIKSLIIGNK
jgi:hypothetical protein